MSGYENRTACTQCIWHTLIPLPVTNVHKLLKKNKTKQKHLNSFFLSCKNKVDLDVVEETGLSC